MHSAGLASGYYSWASKEGTVDRTYSSIPLRAFYKGYMSAPGGTRGYGSIEAGAAFSSVDVEGVGSSDTETDFNMMFGFGAEIPMSKSLQADLAATLEMILGDTSPRNAIGLRAGIRYIFGN